MNIAKTYILYAKQRSRPVIEDMHPSVESVSYFKLTMMSSVARIVCKKITQSKIKSILYIRLVICLVVGRQLPLTTR